MGGKPHNLDEQRAEIRRKIHTYKWIILISTVALVVPALLLVRAEMVVDYALAAVLGGAFIVYIVSSAHGIRTQRKRADRLGAMR